MITEACEGSSASQNQKVANRGREVQGCWKEWQNWIQHQINLGHRESPSPSCRLSAVRWRTRVCCYRPEGPRVKESILLTQGTTGSCDRTFNKPFLISVDLTQAREFFERQHGYKSARPIMCIPGSWRKRLHTKAPLLSLQECLGEWPWSSWG